MVVGYFHPCRVECRGPLRTKSPLYTNTLLLPLSLSLPFDSTFQVTRPPSGELGVGTLVARQKKQRNVAGYQWVIEYEQGDATAPVKGIISERNIQRLLLSTNNNNTTTPEEEEEHQGLIATTTTSNMMTGEEHPATVSDTSIIHSSTTSNAKMNGGTTTNSASTKTAAAAKTAKKVVAVSATANHTSKRTKHHPQHQPEHQHNKKGITTRLGQPVRKTVLTTGILYVYLETRRAEFVRTK
jgi:hypothetical protein